eukprot:3143586-Amphidinium_carterae.2
MALGIEASDLIFLELVTNGMRFELQPNKCLLLVSKSFMMRKDSFELLSATPCKLWRFPSFVFSRWATVGSCARRKFMLDRGLVSSHETSSAQKLQGGVLHLAATLSLVTLVSFLPESLMTMLLRDPRIENESFESFPLVMQIVGAKFLILCVLNIGGRCMLWLSVNAIRGGLEVRKDGTTAKEFIGTCLSSHSAIVRVTAHTQHWQT